MTDLERARKHLLDLLGMLPSFDDQEFWDRFAEIESPEATDGPHYVISNLSVVLKMAGSQDGTLEWLGQYPLMFFDTADEKLHELLDRVGNYPSAQPGRTGRRWCEDVAATAWRIYVEARAQNPRQGE